MRAQNRDTHQTALALRPSEVEMGNRYMYQPAPSQRA